MSAPVMDKPDTGDGATPPVPEGSVMVTLKIARFDPENPDGAGFQSFRVPALPSDRLLNLLHYAKWYLDGTLTWRARC
jgi:succinate dehydrogenase / fumarate reductase iron-sulfur subunit